MQEVQPGSSVTFAVALVRAESHTMLCIACTDSCTDGGTDQLPSWGEGCAHTCKRKGTRQSAASSGRRSMPGNILAMSVKTLVENKAGRGGLKQQNSAQKQQKSDAKKRRLGMQNG
eukprot:1140248-Pelagomonas_calceolata.AAC.2